MVLRDVQDLEAARIAQAREQVGETAVGRAVAWTLVATFLLMVGLVPALDVVGGSGPPWQELQAGPPVQANARRAWTRAVVDANRALIERLERFEEAIEDRSATLVPVRRLVQSVLWRGARAGNARVVAGRDGWLFLRDDVDHVAGRGFLDPRLTTAHGQPRHSSEADRAADPVGAILDFRDQLARRGIALVLLPTPVKPVVESGSLVPGASAPLQNRSWNAFVAAMRHRGVRVVDVSGALVEAGRRTGSPQFLATDTHWRPDAVRLAAALVGAAVEEAVSLSPPALQLTEQPGTVTQHGDLFFMLDLPEHQTAIAPESVGVLRIRAEHGDEWRPTRNAEVLLLGDSFTNIYSLASLGWGTGAGLAEQLSLVLRRPVDRISRNDDGAYATRELLADAERNGGGRLTGVRVVVYQFAMRELGRGDWKRIELP